MTKRIIGVWMQCVIILIAQGCASLDERLRPVQPKVVVDAIKIEDASLSGLTALLTLNVHNPNRFALNAKGLEYSLALAGTVVLSGESDHDMSVPALGNGKIEIPVRVSYASIAEILPKILKTGIADYHFSGKLHTRLFNIPFAKKDELKLPYMSGSRN